MSAESLLAEIDGLRSELAVARRVVQAVERYRQNHPNEPTTHPAFVTTETYCCEWHLFAAAVGGPGPTPEAPEADDEIDPADLADDANDDRWLEDRGLL